MKSTRQTLNQDALRSSLQMFQMIGEIVNIEFLTYPIENVDGVWCSDLSKSRNGNDSEIIGYFRKDKKTYYVFPKKEGRKIKMPKNSSKFFFDYGTKRFLPTLKKIDVSGLDASNIKNCTKMFGHVGQDNPDGVQIIGLNTWNTMAPENCSMMFQCYNQLSPRVEINISSWNMENCRNFEWMFVNCGQKATSWYIGDISKWSIQKALNVSAFMYGISPFASFKLDLSNWDSELLYQLPQNFITNNFFKVKEPNWQAMVDRNNKKNQC